MDLHKAAMNALERGRKTDGLTVSITDSKPCYVEAVVYGGKEPETAVIALNSVMSSLGRCHCFCKDFQFTWYPHIHEVKDNLFEFPEYINKSNTSPTRAVTVPGMCKHLLALYDKLVASGDIPSGGNPKGESNGNGAEIISPVVATRRSQE